MQAATSFDEDARFWSVMGQLKSKQAKLQTKKSAAQQRVDWRSRTHIVEMMTAASMAARVQDEIDSRWVGGPNVLAFLFCPPDTAAFRALDLRGQYFDHRTNFTWDLFFPGYYQSIESAQFERKIGAQPAGTEFAADWYFHPEEFNRFREQIEDRSMGRFDYSGEADLVLVNSWVPDLGPVVVDWESTMSAQLVDPRNPGAGTSLPQAIERISRDIERALGEADYGVNMASNEPAVKRSGIGRELFVGVIAEIVASIAVGS